jgi:hypothetical protein
MMWADSNAKSLLGKDFKSAWFNMCQKNNAKFALLMLLVDLWVTTFQATA